MAACRCCRPLETLLTQPLSATASVQFFHRRACCIATCCRCRCFAACHIQLSSAAASLDFSHRRMWCNARCLRRWNLETCLAQPWNTITSFKLRQRWIALRDSHFRCRDRVASSLSLASAAFSCCSMSLHSLLSTFHREVSNHECMCGYVCVCVRQMCACVVRASRVFAVLRACMRHACICACVHLRVRAFARACMRACVHACMHVHMHACKCTSARVCLSLPPPKASTPLQLPHA